MYKYDQYDQAIVDARVDEFRDQVQRRLAGRDDRGPVQAAAADERPLSPAPRLHAARRDALWHARQPADADARRTSRASTTAATAISPRARTSSTTGSSWSDAPDILADLATVEMHAIQTSGNCIRNIIVRPVAGAAADEVADPRPWAELIRQWSTFHPEFSYLPRKFKIAVIAARRGPRGDAAARHRHPAGRARRRARRARLRRRRHGPHADDRARDQRLRHRRRSAELSRGVPARLQSLRPPRQHLQGADQDPGPRARRRRISPPGRGGVRRGEGARHRPAAAELERITAMFAPPAFDADAPDDDRPQRPRLRGLARPERRRRTSSRATRSSTSA